MHTVFLVHFIRKPSFNKQNTKLMKLNLKVLSVFLLIIGLTFQCTEDSIEKTLSKEDIKREIESRSDYKNFVLSSAINYVMVSKLSDNVRNEIESLSSELLAVNGQNSMDKKKVERFNELTNGLSDEPIVLYPLIKQYLESRFIFSQNDLEEVLSSGVSTEIQKNAGNASGRVKYIDGCQVVCAVIAYQAGFANRHDQQMFYSGCFVGCHIR